MNISNIKVSIIIPAYNAEKTIINTLVSLNNQRKIKKSNFEIIVIDDGSTDKTLAVIEKFIEENQTTNLKIITQKNKGPAYARNIGAKQAKGDILLFTDADCECADDWIFQMISKFLGNQEIVGVKGRYKTKQTSIIAKFVQYEYEYKYEKMKKYKYIDFIDTYSAGFLKEKFLEMGGYNTDFPVACAEDIELSFRMKKKNFKMIFNPEAIVYHIHPETLYDYIKKKIKFAYWRMKVIKMHPEFLINDSHTPQNVKFEIIFFNLTIFFCILALIFKLKILYFSFLFIIGYIISILDFYLFLIKKDKIFLVTGIFMVIIKTVSQSIGIIKKLIK